MRRTKEEAAQTRESLLNAALVEFSEKGYGSATLEEIAAAAGLTRGAIYWHFGGKAQIFQALVQERFTRIGSMLSQAFTLGGSPYERLQRILVHSLTIAENDPDYRAILELSWFKMEMTPELEAGMKERAEATWAFLDTISGLIRSGVRQGEFRADLNPRDGAITAVGFLNGITSLWLMSPDQFSLSEKAESLVDIFLNGFRA